MIYQIVLQDETDFEKLVEIAHRISMAYQSFGALCTNSVTVTQGKSSGEVGCLNVGTLNPRTDDCVRQNHLVCPYCGTDHLMKDCPEFRATICSQGENQYLNRLNLQSDFIPEATPPRDTDGRNGPPFCIFCQRRGHSMANCWVYQESVRGTRSPEQLGGETSFRNTHNSPQNSRFGFYPRRSVYNSADQGVRQQFVSDGNNRRTSSRDSGRQHPLNFRRDR